MKKYIEPSVKLLALTAEAEMLAGSETIPVETTPVSPSNSDAKDVELTSTSVWDE